MSTEKVAIIGSGLVGKSWAMIFASAGYNVTLYDIDKDQVTKALSNIADELDQFEKEGVLRGKISAAAQKELISGTTELSECIKVSVFYHINSINLNLIQKKGSVRFTRIVTTCKT